MYLSYFGLTEAPFSIAPDPRYLYMSQRHQEALAHLLYGVNAGGGFVLLTGEVGAGKTTVCRCLLEQIPESCDIAYIFNPKLTVTELLSTICTEFGIDCPPDNTSVKVYIDSINAYLLDAHARNRHTVLIIDEAQNLSADVLEQLRLLTNLETNQRKLLQIILLGQPELATMLEKQELRQLAQRVIARYHLGPLGKEEVAAYIQHRLAVAGVERQLFPSNVIGQLFRLSEGIPRIINVLCDRALLGTYAQNKDRVDSKTLSQAAREVFHKPQKRSMVRPLLVGLLVASTALAATRYLPTIQSALQAPSPAVKAEAVAAKPEKIIAEILVWPVSEPIEHSQELAYAALFKTWGADFKEGNACKQARKIGLRCHAARGWLDELRQLNMPAVLQMHDAHGQNFDATLITISDKSATFVVGHENREVSLGALAQQWSGHYTLLWRPPHLASAKLRPGDYGPDITWLAGQLAHLEGKTINDKGGRLFDEAMRHEVKRFQKERGLSPDGRVGQNTLLHLSSLADDTPKLGPMNISEAKQ